jgi:murein DD-endopeptidase MepM/ murein hydrolase activator NlpD
VSLRRRIAQKTFPPVVMLATAALLVGTSVPATALFDPDAPPAATTMATLAASDAVGAPELAEGQVVEVEVDEGAELATTVASRDEWSVTSYAELLRLKYGSRDFSYSTTGSGAVRWPFPAAVPISSGFGERVAPCRYCSSFHQGLDFNPGAGTPIWAIADGIVIKAEHSGGFGNHAIIEHVINGQRVTSTYAHMTRDSSPLVVGQEILVGDFLGTVGSTGTSTGAHLHFEIRIDDIAIDPFAWLKANAS